MGCGGRWGPGVEIRVLELNDGGWEVGSAECSGLRRGAGRCQWQATACGLGANGWEVAALIAGCHCEGDRYAVGWVSIFVCKGRLFDREVRTLPFVRVLCTNPMLASLVPAKSTPCTCPALFLACLDSGPHPRGALTCPASLPPAPPRSKHSLLRCGGGEREAGQVRVPQKPHEALITG